MKTVLRLLMRTPLRGAWRLRRPPRVSMGLTALVGAFWFSAALPGHAEAVTSAEAKAATQGWLGLIERVKGHWGAALRPEIGQVVELQVSNRLVGYYCPVVSGGYVVLSVHKELEPVVAYSVRGGLDPQELRGPSGLVRGMLHGQLRGLEQRIGPLETAKPEQFQAVLNHDYRPAWKKLQDAAAGPAGIHPNDASYQGGGGVLLSDSWHQFCPYNLHCPDRSCNQLNCCWTDPRVVVGCVPLSAAQIMRHWGWPIAGHNFTAMPNTLMCVSPPDYQIEAVSRLLADIRDHMTTSDGCDKTGAYLWLWSSPFIETMEENYRDNFYYDVDAGHDRSDYTDDEWWNGIVQELGRKQPVHYQMDVLVDGLEGGHAFVVDGWEVVSGSRLVHVNYGWGVTMHGGQTVLGWVSLNALSFSVGNEGRLFNVVPVLRIGSSVSGSYSGFHYFNQDASGANGTFQPGGWVQFLPSLRLLNSGGASDAITFRGSAASPTLLFAKANTATGLRIANGALKLRGGGCLRLFPQVAPRYPHLTKTYPVVRIAWDRGYSDDETTVIEVSANRGPWAVVATVDASLTFYDDVLTAGQWADPRAYRLRSSARGCLSPASDIVVAWQ